MAIRTVHIEEIGEVEFRKRRNSRHVRIRVDGAKIKVTQPLWVPYKIAQAYVLQKKSWILQHKKSPTVLQDGDMIGKNHTIQIKSASGSKIHTKIHQNVIVVHLPDSQDVLNNDVQQKLHNSAAKALIQQADEYVPTRLDELATRYGFRYSGCSVKKLKSRWGSCSKDTHIIINAYLMQVPWPLIDYVLLHELTHTEHFNHSPQFWARMQHCLPNVQVLRARLKQYSPHIISRSPPDVA